MSQYDSDIASAAADIADAGAPVVFTRTRQAKTPGSNVLVPTTLTAASNAMQVKTSTNTLQQFMAQGLVIIDPVTLLVAAGGMAFDPKPGDTFAWATKTFTVRAVDPTAPDGTPMLFKVFGSK